MRAMMEISCNPDACDVVALPELVHSLFMVSEGDKSDETEELPPEVI